jgi:hypothetical protein
MTVADDTERHLANIAAPADATHVGEWDDYDTGRWSRPLTGARHRRDVKVVGVAGRRWHCRPPRHGPL